MQFDTIVEVFVPALVQADDFGGYIEQPTLATEINAFITPAEEVLTLNNNNIVRVSVTKLFTNDDVPSDATLVKCNGKEYEITSYCNFGKIIMLKMSAI